MSGDDSTLGSCSEAVAIPLLARLRQESTHSPLSCNPNFKILSLVSHLRAPSCDACGVFLDFSAFERRLEPQLSSSRVHITRITFPVVLPVLRSRTSPAWLA